MRLIEYLTRYCNWYMQVFGNKAPGYPTLIVMIFIIGFGGRI